LAPTLRRTLDADLLSPQEIEALLRACSNRAPTGIRNRALIALTWRSGLRIGEVHALKPKDTDLDHGTLTFSTARVASGASSGSMRAHVRLARAIG
jgi:integrase